MAIERTYAEINEKIKSGKAVVLTAEEVLSLVEEKGVSGAARQVDVVTTGTFSAMCSSGVFLNFGHPKPRIRMQKVWLNGIPAYSGIAAVDAYLGATELPEDDPCNSNYPGEFRYGGGHVIHDLVARKPIKLEAVSYGTDCYPRRELETCITLDDINEATLQSAQRLPELQLCGKPERPDHLYLSGDVETRPGQRPLLQRRPIEPAPERPVLSNHRNRHQDFPGGGTGYVA